MRAGVIEREIDLGEGIGLPVTVLAAQEPRGLLIWLPSERGVRSGMTSVAAQIAARTGYEVWVADPFTGWLLPASVASLGEIPASALARVVDHALSEHETVFLMAHDRGSGLALRTARAWQAGHPGDRGLHGLVLLTPNLFQHTPRVGKDGVFEPVARSTNLPVFVMQPALSPTALRLSEISETLGIGGARVYQRLLPAVRDRFFFRPDATADERALAETLPELVGQALALLATESLPDSPATEVAVEAEDQAADERQQLTVYRGTNADDPPPLVLKDLAGKTRDLESLRGQVVLLNFWASWCPPCLHEMPSMQRIHDRYQPQGFTVAAVNLGEAPERIQPFLDDLKIDFPVWLDPENVSARSWQVFAYPTSFLLDRAGHIRYAIAGGIDWETPEATARIEELLSESTP
ncbi:MAG: redoxin domain-containing protein [Halothiobacillaceae bacterium]